MRKEKKEEEIKEEKKETKEKKSIEKKEKEIFNIEDKLKDKAETENIEQETQETSKEEIKRQNEILKNFFIWLGVVIFIVIIAIVGINSIRNFKYKGLEFSSEKYGDLIFYKTSFPVRYEDKVTGKVVSADYNFYIRNDPRNLDKKVLINGNIIFRENIVLDLTTEELFCDGDWNLAMGNLMKFNLFGINLLVKNQTIKYEPENEYMFITINKGNVTEIKQLNETSYEININNCEILSAVERLMVEAFIRYKELNN